MRQISPALIKPVLSAEEAVARIPSGSTVLIGGWSYGTPTRLIEALAASPAESLTIVYTAVGRWIEPLLFVPKLRKVISSFGSMPHSSMRSPFDDLYRRGLVELELVPQGVLAERLHAGASGVPAFYIAAGADMKLGEARETRTFDGQVCLLERAIRGDFALIHAKAADRYGNLLYRLSSKNFNPVMALAADHVLCEVEQIVEVGEIEPDRVDTPGCCVEALVPLQGEGGCIRPESRR